MSLRDPRNGYLLRELTISQYKLKDQSTFFGLLWSFLNPLLMLGVLFLVFSRRVGGDVEQYGLYLLVGIVQYTYFANATQSSMRSLLSMKQLTKETVFPKELLVLSSTLSSTLDFVIAMMVCVLVAYLSGVDPSWAQLMLPVALLLQFLMVVWVSLLLACVYPLARDLDHIYQVFLRALFFATPIFYTASFLGEGVARYLLVLNPLAQLIGLSRGILIYDQPPQLGLVVGLTLANGLLIWFSWWFFKRFEQRIAESL